nr:uncharacterized protein I203_00221 [Kwoniella mangroviensis CBS 8507]OCF70090.1 hypothetical protein I203_00221 [Kwoniella mangroviensis CBS 8507]
MVSKRKTLVQPGLPRTGKTKSKLHTSAVSLPSKLRTTEVVPADIPSIAEAFNSIIRHDEPSTSRSQQQKKADFIAAVQSAPHPYMIKSKSHLRREKRKVKTLNSSTNLQSLENALETILPDVDRSEEHDGTNGKMAVNGEGEKRKVKKDKEVKKIGEGKGRTLGEKKRRDVIQEASKRIPAVLSHPAYKSNPWAAIREHVGNTIVAKDKNGSVKH